MLRALLTRPTLPALPSASALTSSLFDAHLPGPSFLSLLSKLMKPR
jgi:hypothetical protein